jgi:hypothetical protein
MIVTLTGHDVAQTVSRRLPIARPVFDPLSGYARIVVDEVTLGQVSSEYFGFPCQL